MRSVKRISRRRILGMYVVLGGLALPGAVRSVLREARGRLPGRA